jgi:F-type H+-transporting ATPase subunit b
MELFMPEAGLVFWMFVVFVVLFAILAKFAWPVITKMVDERASLIDKGVEYAEAAKASLEDSEAQARAILAEANRQQMEILQEAAQMKAHIIEEAKKAAAAEAKKLVDAAAISIEQSRKEAELQFRQEVSQFALTIAENIIRKELAGDKAQAEMVEQLLNELEHKN